MTILVEKLRRITQMAKVEHETEGKRVVDIKDKRIDRATDNIIEVIERKLLLVAHEGCDTAEFGLYDNFNSISNDVALAWVEPSIRMEDVEKISEMENPQVFPYCSPKMREILIRLYQHFLTQGLAVKLFSVDIANGIYKSRHFRIVLFW